MTKIKNNDGKYFLWCHIRHLNPLKTHPKRIKKVDRQMVSGLDYDNIKFPVSKKDYSKIEQKIAFELMYSHLKMVGLSSLCIR